MSRQVISLVHIIRYTGLDLILHWQGCSAFRTWSSDCIKSYVDMHGAFYLEKSYENFTMLFEFFLLFYFSREKAGFFWRAGRTETTRSKGARGKESSRNVDLSMGDAAYEILI